MWILIFYILIVEDGCSCCSNQAARKLGFPILYGDGSRPAVLQSAGISSPKAVMVMYTGKSRTIDAVQRIRLAFPAVKFISLKHVYVHCFYFISFILLICNSWRENYA